VMFFQNFSTDGSFHSLFFLCFLCFLCRRTWCIHSHAITFNRAGPESIIEASGRDATETFLAVHSLPMLDDLDIVGILE